ncbi:MAG TPA: glycosyltransferase family 39 protein [Chloroflexia bacterium]|nr:glycosyltransferase family 39 protein [Chloroflexia bacterium]
MSLARPDNQSTNQGLAALRLPLLYKLTWQRVALFGILGLSAFLNLIALDPNYYTNEFYAAGVRSMLTSWHNFFYNAYDPGGFITVDKPPVAFWFQAVSAWLFGYSGVSILLPSALAGVISVALVYSMVNRIFGTVPGLLAALALAVTPISVIMNRHNNPESLLVLSLVLAAWAFSRAVEKGRLTWLMLGVALVGVGFNIKMLEAFVVLPAFYLLYFLLAPLGWWKRIAHLAVATVVLAVVSLSWATIVDLTPASQRPYIGGSTDNTVLNLAIDYNGLGRIDGSEFGGNRGGNFARGGQPPAGFPFGGAQGQPGANNGVQFGSGNGFRQPGNFGNGQPGNGNSFRQPGSNSGNNQAAGGNGFGQRGNNTNPFQARGGGGGNPVVAGRPGLFRMFDPQLAGEAGWLLPIALFGLLVAAIQTWRRFPAGKERLRRQQALMLWGGWLIMFMAVFSKAQGIFHSYYLVMLAPAIAALFGIAIEALWYSYRQGSWRSLLLPAGLVGTAVFQLNILSAYSDWNRSLALGVAGLEVITATALLVVPRLLNRNKGAVSTGMAAIALVGLLAAPFAWAVNAILNKTYSNATLPTAIPSGRAGGGFFGFGFNNAASSSLLNRLTASWNGYLTGLLIITVGLLSVIAAIYFFRQQLGGRNPFEKALVVVTALVVIVFGMSLSLTALPPVASASSNTVSNSFNNLSAGVIGNPQMALSNDAKLISFLEANRNGSTYLLATTSSQNASPIIIKTGQPVMAMGGFMGSDKVLTTAELVQLVQNNTVRYFLLDGIGFGRGGSQQPVSWVQQNCKVVDPQLWSSTSSNSAGSSRQGLSGRFGNQGRGGAQGQLYECASAAQG